MNNQINRALRLIAGKGIEDPAPRRSEVKAPESSDVELLDACSRAVIKVANAVSPAVVGIAVGWPSARQDRVGGGHYPGRLRPD
ncbi:MAG: hypothetical protein M0P73_09990 [Syntrophobacterales bacterium]|jgi:hypothetical protein|nr:hypothetical protein [Syntrophobacterales bacterium]